MVVGDNSCFGMLRKTKERFSCGKSFLFLDNIMDADQNAKRNKHYKN